MNRLSVGARLTLWYLVIFAAAQAVFGFGMWFILRQSFRQIADEELRGQVDDLTKFLQAQKKNATVAKLQEEVSEAYIIEHSGDFLQILDGEGNWIFRADALRRSFFVAPDPSSVESASFSDRQFNGGSFRFLTVRVEANGRVYTVQTGVPMDRMVRTLSVFRRYLLMFAPLLLLAAATGGFWLSRRALSPVDSLTRAAASISGHNLSHRLDVPQTKDELQRLAETLNQMLARIENAFLRITQFTADASHELRTPISLIRAEAEIILRKTRKEDEYRSALRHILLEAERTTTMVEELLSLARADSGGESLHLVLVDLGSLIKEAAGEWRQIVEGRGLQFMLHVLNSKIQTWADRAAIRRVLGVLIDNAMKYTPPPGVIALWLDEKDGTVCLRVQDSGIGIATEDQSKVFERFYRADKARNRELGGAGLGLSIAQWIVQQHHGAITLESKLGSGTTFSVNLPQFVDDHRTLVVSALD